MREKPQKRRLTADEAREVTRLWGEGTSTADIGRYLDVANGSVVKALLLELGIDWHERRLWRGGRTINDQGYVLIWTSVDSPYATMRNSVGYVPEHRLVMAQRLGRTLTRREQVHHVNGDRSDNRIENLQLRSGHHGPGARHQCVDCGSWNVLAVDV